MPGKSSERRTNTCQGYIQYVFSGVVFVIPEDTVTKVLNRLCSCGYQIPFEGMSRFLFVQGHSRKRILQQPTKSPLSFLYFMFSCNVEELLLLLISLRINPCSSVYQFQPLYTHTFGFLVFLIELLDTP